MQKLGHEVEQGGQTWKHALLLTHITRSFFSCPLILNSRRYNWFEGGPMNENLSMFP